MCTILFVGFGLTMGLILALAMVIAYRDQTRLRPRLSASMEGYR